MELRQLRYFVAIAAAGSLSKASERLHVAQPALSLQLANLEADLGTVLFDRYSRGVKLTQSGLLLLEHAEAILKLVGDARHLIRRDSGHIKGTVSIGFPTTVPAMFIVALLRKVAAELPEVRLRLSEHNSAYLGNLLREGSVDLAILMNAPDDPSINIQPLLFENYCLVSPPHFRGESDSMSWNDTVALPLILPSAHSGLRIMIEDAATRSGHRLTLTAELDSARLIVAGVQAGLGHAILPRSSLFPEMAASGLAFHTIVDPEIKSSLQLASSAVRQALPAQTVIRELLVDLIRDFVADKNWNADLHWSLSGKAPGNDGAEERN